MATIHWKSATKGDWATAARWAGGVAPGASDDVFIDPAGTYGVTINGAEAAHAFTLDDAGATVAVKGTLTLGSTLDLANGEFDLNSGGAIVGGTLSATGGAFVWNGGTLSGVTFKGPLNVNGALNIKDGLKLTGAGGTGAGVLNLTGDVLHVVAGEALDNATLNISGGTPCRRLGRFRPKSDLRRTPTHHWEKRFHRRHRRQCWIH